ncbi:MAG: hypothetical protein LDL06_03190 [Candidatus Nitrosotenuis sp.]|nr:hypothetical protein [Candidatus Nitrosotenuis sp.]
MKAIKEHVTNIIIGLILAGLLVLLPIHNVYAFTIPGVEIKVNVPDWKGISDELNDKLIFLKSIDEDFTDIQAKLMAGKFLNISEKLKIENALYEMEKYPEQFFYQMMQNPVNLETFMLYLQAKSDIILDTIKENPEDASPELTDKLHTLSYSMFQIQMAYAYSEDFEMEITSDVTEQVFDNIKIKKLRTDKEISVLEYMNRSVNDIPLVRGLGIENVSFHKMLKINIESGHIFRIPIIPVSENHRVSVQEYCVMNIDELRCERMMMLATFAQMMVQKDPDAAFEATRIFLLFANDINNETDAGFDSELEYAIFLSNLSKDELINLKIIELDDGNYVSLNDISKIKCKDEIPLLEKIIEYSNSDNIDERLLDEDFKMIIKNMDEIQNNQCSLKILATNEK